MKKKGFTLIELLAVIVILAIIALIATPIVMNVIENARKGAAERSAENYIRTVETAIMEARLDGTILSDREYSLSELEDKLGRTIEVNGNKPSEGYVKIVDGSLVIDSDTEMTVGDYTVSYDEEGKFVATKIVVEEEIPEDVELTVYSLSENQIRKGDFLTPSDYVLTAAELQNDFYLKHDLSANNKVIQSYVCAALNIGDVEEVCFREGTAEDVSKLEWLGENGCNGRISGSDPHCNINSLEISMLVEYSTEIMTADYGKRCAVYSDGSAYCGL